MIVVNLILFQIYQGVIVILRIQSYRFSKTFEIAFIDSPEFNEANEGNSNILWLFPKNL